MNPSSAQNVPPSVCPGASAGLTASTSSGSSQTAPMPNSDCMASRSLAASTSAVVKHGSRYPWGVKPESVPSSACWPR